MTRLRRFYLRAARHGGQAAASAWQGYSRGITVALATVGVILGGAETLLACPLCFGAEETPLIDATKLGIIVMLGITLAVQGGFVAFFLYLRRRARRMAEADLDIEWSELQRGSRTS